MATGTLSTAGQHDWLETSLAADQAYLFTITGLVIGSSVEIGPAAEINNTLLSSVYTLDGGSEPLDLFYEPTSAGDYYIDVTGDTPSNYTVTGTAVSTDYKDNETTAGSVVIGGPATHGTLSVVGQHDWLALSLTANQGYEFTVAGLGTYATVLAGPADEIDNSLRSASIAYPGVTPGTTDVFYEPVTSGIYYLDISTYGTTASYSVTGTTVATDYTDNATTSGAVTIGGPATKGTLASLGQHDWLRVSLTANQGYLFTMTGLSSRDSLDIGPAGELDDSLLYSAFSVFSFGTYTTEAWYEPATTGTYFLDLYTGAGTTSYSVSGSAVPTSYADNASTTGTIAINGPATTGSLSAGEHDWLKLSLVANQGYLFNISGLGSDAFAEVGPTPILDDSLLSSFSMDTSLSESTTQVFYEPATTGTFYLDLSSTGSSAPGTYSVTGVTVATDYTDNASTSGVVNIGGPATTGTLSTPGQHDWLKLSLVANTSYLLTVTGLDSSAEIFVGPTLDATSSLTTTSANNFIAAAANGLDDTLLSNVDNFGTAAGPTTPQQVWYEPATTGTYYIDISDGANTASYSVTGAIVPHDYTDNTTTTGVVIACFAAGTLIATKTGPVAVEALRCGDRIRRHQGGYASVKWLGQRRIVCSKHPNPKAVWPVRINAHAFGRRQPERALFLSPDHAIFAEGVLIPIKYLLNGNSIVQDPCSDITYWHVELEQHEVILANGLPCESYLDTGNRAAFANGDAVIKLHPDFAVTLGAAVWEAAACAPLRIAGDAVDRVKTRLRGLARAKAAPLTASCDLVALLRPNWYLCTNPDVAADGVDAAMHYTTFGRTEGRLPCPEMDLIRALGLVDPAMHIFSMADVIEAGADPVAHFCNGGWREGRQPNAYFDTRWYRQAHDVPGAMNPLLHYILLGEGAGLLPGAHFNPTWYRYRYRLPATVSPLAHYLAHRHTQAFSPLPSFDVAAYVEAHAATLRPRRDPYAHFLAYGCEGLDRAA